MKWRYALAAAAVLVLGGGVLFSQYWYYLPGIIGRIMDPIGEHQPVVWQSGPAQAESAAEDRPPNIVLILADDMGFNDVTFFGGGLAGGTVPTPHIDSIARQGVAFRSGYSGNGTCAPSRAAMLTGRYSTRSGFEFTPANIEFARLIAGFESSTPNRPIFYEDRAENRARWNELSMPDSEITIAELLKEKDYHSVMLGKWHLGGTEDANPNAQGFDEYLGFHPGAALFLPVDDSQVVNSRQDFDPIDQFLWPNLSFAVRYNGGARFHPDRYMTDYLADEATKVIRANRNRPFFMFLSFNAPHTPLQATKEDFEALAHIEHHAERVYAGMIRSLDRAVGRVLAELKAQGLEDNTLVIFTSDNGGAHYIGLPDVNAPFRGWKITFFEGGIRVPFFARWPARIPAGTVYEKPIAHVDIFATAAAAAGVAMPSDRVMDGVDWVPWVRGRHRRQDPHESLFWRSGHYRVLQKDGWKLQLNGENAERVWLHNLSEDPTERNNLAQQRPDKLREMRLHLDAIDAEQTEPLWQPILDGSIPIDRTLDAEYQPDEEFIYWPN